MSIDAFDRLQLYIYLLKCTFTNVTYEIKASLTLLINVCISVFTEKLFFGLVLPFHFKYSIVERLSCLKNIGTLNGIIAYILFL